MLLAIDCGNTNVVFAAFEGKKIVGEWRSATKVQRTSDDYGVWLTELMVRHGLDPTMVVDAIIASVVPDKNQVLSELCERYFNCTAIFIGHSNTDIGIKVLLKNPKEVGDDRLANAVAAHDRFGGPLIIVDFGTATTFDVLDPDGNYVGGVIAPGINLSMEALHMGAAQLPRISVVNPGQAPVVGDSTVSAMESGVFWGYVGLIEGLVRRIQVERGGSHKVVATGGFAALFAAATSVLEHVEPHLTMHGLHTVWRLNKG